MEQHNSRCTKIAEVLHSTEESATGSTTQNTGTEKTTQL